MTAGRDANVSVDLEELARRAADGDGEALAGLLRGLQHPMYRLSLRFLGHPHGVQDACQEILIRIVTHLGSFEERFRFTTWAYTVATRSLLRTQQRFVESAVQGPDDFVRSLDADDIDTTMEEAAYQLLCEEVRISCTYGMLLCIPRAQRAAYLLADVVLAPLAKQLHGDVAIGDLYRFDRFAAPAALWEDFQRRYPDLLDAR